MLGISQVRIQRGVGSGNITIDKINPDKSIILCGTMMYSSTCTSGSASWNYAHATILNETTINIGSGTTMAWTVIEFGGAV